MTGSGQLIAVHPEELKFQFTLQAQIEYPPDMQCKDKFLPQITIVAPHTEVDEFPQDTFNKDYGKTIEECKLRVVYISPQAAVGNSEDEALEGSKQSSDTSSNQALQRLKDERDTAMRQTQLLQQELDMVKRQRNRKSEGGFSFTLSLLVAAIGIMVGFPFKPFIVFTFD